MTRCRVRGAVNNGMIALLAGACGTAEHRSNATGPRQAADADYAQAAEASCATGETHDKPRRLSCVFVLADGRRFSCPQRFGRAVQTASALERSAACRVIAPLHLSAAVRRVTATIESTQVCLASHTVRAIGNAVLPPLADPASADGELIAGQLPKGALIAFYRDTKKATRLEPAVLDNARRIHAQVERRGGATILWLRMPAPPLRRAVQDCLPLPHSP